MCGIAGIISLSGRPVTRGRERVSRMTRMLIHRGPDQQGVVATDDGLAVLGTTRLAIVDPETKVPVPFARGDGGPVLAFNGEVYDYRALRESLAAAGTTFTTGTDTEVLFEGLRQRGLDLLDSLDGMWAFAWYDPAERHLVLSRDLMGERHLFYMVTGDELLFASEPDPIVADQAPQGMLEIDEEAVASAMMFNTAPPGRTLIRQIRRLLPGRVLEVTVGRPVPEQRRYRRLHPERWFDFFAARPALDQAIRQFRDVFEAAVMLRLPTDVPFISTLSGGLDSTLIAHAAAQGGARRITTLYGESSEEARRQQGDELDEYAASCFTAARIGSDHRTIRMMSTDAVPVLVHAAAHGFDGCVDPGIGSFEMLAAATRGLGFKVILISDGPDELLGGYISDQKAWAVNDRQRADSRLAFEARRLMSSFRNGRRVMQRLGMGKRIIPPQVRYDPFRFIPTHQTAPIDYLANFLTLEVLDRVQNAYGHIEADYADVAAHMDWSQKRALSYATLSLPDIFNLRTDKAFLHQSVECRVPYQAPAMVEFMLAAPAEYRFAGPASGKRLMREMVRSLVGPQVADRAKYGFSLPLHETSQVSAGLGIEEKLRCGRFLDHAPFRRGALEFLLQPEHTKLRWRAFALTSTLERLEQLAAEQPGEDQPVLSTTAQHHDRL
ncbi:MAG: asparagine synthase (glutamine-hydrolyzing) [Pseudomonadota bacterium]